MEIGQVAMVAGHSNKQALQALRRRDVEEVKRLTEEEQFNPLEKIGKNGQNALHIAAMGGQLEVLKYFTEERGCNPASQDSNGWTPLHYAAGYNHFDLVQYLIDEQKIDPVCQTKDGNTPLHYACLRGSPALVDYLVNAMSKYLPVEEVVKFKGQYGWAPVHFAAFGGKMEILKSNLNFDPFITDDNGRIPLHPAAQQGHLQAVKFFVEQQKCDPSHMDKRKVTPLFLAAGKGHLDVVKYLTLEQHCDPLCTTDNNDTPLHVAAYMGQVEVVKFYIEHLHCSPDIRGQHNKTPLQLARHRAHDHVVEYLKSVTPDPIK